MSGAAVAVRKVPHPMLAKPLKVLSLSLVSYLSTCVLAGAASFVTDFNSGIPGGASPAGSTAWSSTNGVGNSGVVKLVYPAPTGLTGGLTVNDIAGGVAITN